MRAKAIARYNLPSLEFSQAYSFFWDQLEKSNLFLQGVCNLFHVPGLIVNVILDVILDQLCKNIDIVIQHLDILTVPASGIDAVHNIIHSFSRALMFRKKTLQPQLCSQILW